MEQDLQSRGLSALSAHGDAELAGVVAAIARGDERALGDLFDCCFDQVYAVALRVLRNDADAEEVAVESFHKAWHSAASFDPARGGVQRWLSAIAWSRAVDRLRRERRRPDVTTLHPMSDNAAYIDRADPAVQRWFDALDARHTIGAVITRLTAAQQRILGLAFFEGLSHSEIADEIGMPLGTVKSHSRRAIEALRAALEQSESSQVTGRTAGFEH